jgi:hypothetical protein
MAKRNYPKITTPKGVLIYPHLSEPDTKFVKPDGEYHTKFALVVDDPETNKFIEALETYLQEYIDANDDELSPAKLKKAGRADLFEEEVDD